MSDRKQSVDQAGLVARYGMLIALAMVFSYIENLLPIQLAVPGIKLGLANLVTIISLYLLGVKGAVTISLSRILLVGMTFGNMSMMLYSLAGGGLSLLVMIIAQKSGWFTPVGVSILGGVFHNVGQLLLAALVVENTGLLYYLPVLLAAGALTGTLIGLLAGLLINRIRPYIRKL